MLYNGSRATSRFASLFRAARGEFRSLGAGCACALSGERRIQASSRGFATTASALLSW